MQVQLKQQIQTSKRGSAAPYLVKSKQWKNVKEIGHDDKLYGFNKSTTSKLTETSNADKQSIDYQRQFNQKQN